MGDILSAGDSASIMWTNPRRQPLQAESREEPWVRTLEPPRILSRKKEDRDLFCARHPMGLLKVH